MFTKTLAVYGGATICCILMKENTRDRMSLTSMVGLPIGTQAPDNFPLYRPCTFPRNSDVRSRAGR
ncbi:hypothetical protein SV7mr_33920 [Stieleria bergensis]|uniref:Uncharacterized protein n=1 Tax=Stieleria bergensis TaxID=2528025 RepID=A0A517SXK4_9BACT|nr:hypothetical protein SV7mr_33920 [Planctomycetes bacterium SV_7m_r]